MSRFLKRVSGWFPGRRIDGDNGEPYLERYYLFGVLGWHAYLHRFVQSDPDRGLHDHPWRRAVSLVLSGGYREIRLLDPETHSVSTRRIRPGRLNVIRGGDFHRVVLDGREAWTLFLHGPRVKGWGFLRKDGFVPYARHGGEFRHRDWWKHTPRGQLLGDGEEAGDAG